MTTHRILAAYGVHLFTATGIVFGFLSLISVIEKQMFAAFVFLGISLIIDGIDGTFARFFNVKSVTPRIDGVTLDNVIDFFTYSVVPATMVWCWELAPEGWNAFVSAGILLASCVTFSNANMKTQDGYFVGFPALWNVAVLYLVLFGAGPSATVFTLSICFILTFIPTTYVHPFRVKLLMPLTLLITSLWVLSTAALAWGVLANGGSASEQPIWQWILILTSVYFAGISLWRSFNTSKVV